MKIWILNRIFFLVFIFKILLLEVLYFGGFFFLRLLGFDSYCKSEYFLKRVGSLIFY